MKLVLVESPYAGDVDTNTEYARLALADCLARGEAPFASHLLYTQPGVLDDLVPEQRALGIEAGLLWGSHAELTAVYADLGFSSGMEAGIIRAGKEDRPVEIRYLPGQWGWSCPARGCHESSREEGYWTQAASLLSYDAHQAATHPRGIKPRFT